MTTTAPRTGAQRYVMLALITGILALSTADRATLSVAGPSMSKDLGLSSVEMGWLFSAFAWAYVIWQLPAGWMVDRLGTKTSVFAGVGLWSLVTFLMAGAGWMPHAFWTLLVLRFLLGTMESPGGPAAARVIATWFPSSERGMAGALFNCAQYLSLGVFMPIMGFVAYHFGWQHVFTVMGVLGLAIAAVWGVLFHVPGRSPRVTKGELEYIAAGGALVHETTTTEMPKAESVQQTWSALKTLMGSRMMVGVFVAQYCISSITFFFVSWFPAYLVKGRGFTILEAGFVAALPAVCGCIGGVTTGFFSDALLRRTGSLSLARKVPITIGLVLSATIIACNYTASSTLVIVLMSLSFFGKGFGSLGWTVIADMAPKESVGLTGGLFNAFSSAAGIVTPVAIGYLVQGTNSFDSALVFVGCHGIAAVLCFWLIVGRIERLSPTAHRAPQPAVALSARP